MAKLSYDYTFMLREQVGSAGITKNALKKQLNASAAKHRRVHQLLSKGDQHFIRNLGNKKHEQEILRVANRLKKEFSQLLVIGIGGSDLGARALQQAFREKTKKQVFFLGDTTDPEELRRVFKQISWKHCAINPVSKSGNTVETLSVFLAARRALIRSVGQAHHAKHILVTTEPKASSSLFTLAKKEGYQVFEHPLHIGGRWTILSNVGLLSAAFSGIDITALRKGGRVFASSAQKRAQNPAMVFAALQFLAMKKGKNVAVLMPYSERLTSFGAWYRQLFAESLGKAKTRSGKRVHTGLTPVAASGPRDQHSQVQLYNEGPLDKTVTFVRVEEKDNLTVPHLRGDKAVDFLGATKFSDILLAEQTATQLALAKHKRPSGCLILPSVDEISLGEFIVFFELACAYLAEMLDVNAFDQPGVEEGKKNMYALLGRPGYEQQAQRLKRKSKSSIA